MLWRSSHAHPCRACRRRRRRLSGVHEHAFVSVRAVRKVPAEFRPEIAPAPRFRYLGLWRMLIRTLTVYVVRASTTVLEPRANLLAHRAVSYRCGISPFRGTIGEGGEPPPLSFSRRASSKTIYTELNSYLVHVGSFCPCCVRRCIYWGYGIQTYYKHLLP